VEARHAPAGIGTGQFAQLGSQRGIALRSHGHVPDPGALEAQAAARVAFAHLIAPLHVADHRPARVGGQRFFPRTSFRIWRFSA
jgi:hypothetical protein